MNVSIIQTTLFWESPEKNRSHFEKLISQVTETDLIILPEMFTTGFSMQPEIVAEENLTTTYNWLKTLAAKKNCSLVGSIATKENESYYNRLHFVKSNGESAFYDKRHLFRMGKEDKHYKAGGEKIIVATNNFKICPLICYDLRFPIWSRNRFNKESKTWDYDVLIYVANWPEVRSYPWKQLLIARAIENQCYVIGVNRIGEDGNGIKHSGDSLLINPRGEIMSKTKPNEESVETVFLDKNYLEEFRSIFPVGLDADEFEIL